MKPIIGILPGEAAGIGPEIVARLCGCGRLLDYCRPVIIGDRRILKMGEKIAGIELPVNTVGGLSRVNWQDQIPMFDLNNLDPDKVTIGKISADSGRATGETIIAALKFCREGAIDGFVYAPLSKAALPLGGYGFADELQLMKHCLNWDEPCGEMNVVDNLWTTRVTGHIPFQDISASLDIEGIVKIVRIAFNTLTSAGCASPRIAVAALNPHAGEGGLCGREEIDIIIPAIETARQQGMAVSGPLPADTVFVRAFDGEFDAVVTMYHDQGQIAMKLKSRRTGVTVLAGLPYPIATTMHGSALDIAGKGTASAVSMEQAVIVAAKMAEWKKGG